jgi:hypothetical protein
LARVPLAKYRAQNGGSYTRKWIAGSKLLDVFDDYAPFAAILPGQ